MLPLSYLSPLSFVASSPSISHKLILTGDIGERREWIKPIMFSGGLGTIDSHLVQKDQPEPGMIVTKVGGPVYRIGVGGGAASSVEVQGTRLSDDVIIMTEI